MLSAVRSQLCPRRGEQCAAYPHCSFAHNAVEMECHPVNTLRLLRRHGGMGGVPTPHAFAKHRVHLEQQAARRASAATGSESPLPSQPPAAIRLLQAISLHLDEDGYQTNLPARLASGSAPPDHDGVNGGSGGSGGNGAPGKLEGGNALPMALVIACSRDVAKLTSDGSAPAHSSDGGRNKGASALEADAGERASGASDLVGCAKLDASTRRPPAGQETAFKSSCVTSSINFAQAVSGKARDKIAPATEPARAPPSAPPHTASLATASTCSAKRGIDVSTTAGPISIAATPPPDLSVGFNLVKLVGGAAPLGTLPGFSFTTQPRPAGAVVGAAVSMAVSPATGQRSTPPAEDDSTPRVPDGHVAPGPRVIAMHAPEGLSLGGLPSVASYSAPPAPSMLTAMPPVKARGGFQSTLCAAGSHPGCFVPLQVSPAPEIEPAADWRPSPTPSSQPSEQPPESPSRSATPSEVGTVDASPARVITRELAFARVDSSMALCCSSCPPAEEAPSLFRSPRGTYPFIDEKDRRLFVNGIGMRMCAMVCELSKEISGAMPGAMPGSRSQAGVELNGELRVRLNATRAARALPRPSCAARAHPLAW